MRGCLEGIHGEKSNFNEKAEQEVTMRDKYRVSGRYAAQLCTCCLRKFLRPVGLLEREFNRFIAKTGSTAKPLLEFRLSSRIQILTLFQSDYCESQYFEKEPNNFRQLICHYKAVKSISKI